MKYRIVDGGVEWAGFSDITRQTLELAARRKSTPGEIMQIAEGKDVVTCALVEALESSANQFVPTRFSYDEFKKLHGDLIFGGLQPVSYTHLIKIPIASLLPGLWGNYLLWVHITM